MCVCACVCVCVCVCVYVCVLCVCVCVCVCMDGICVYVVCGRCVQDLTFDLEMSFYVELHNYTAPLTRWFIPDNRLWLSLYRLSS